MIIALSVTATSAMIAIVGTATCGGFSFEVPVRCGAGSKRPRIDTTPNVTTGTIRNKWIRGESPDCATSAEMMPAEKNPKLQNACGNQSVYTSFLLICVPLSLTRANLVQSSRR
jgi:hypothetical protein